MNFVENMSKRERLFIRLAAACMKTHLLIRGDALAIYQRGLAKQKEKWPLPSEVGKTW